MTERPTGQEPANTPVLPPDYSRPTNQTDWIQHSLNQISGQLGKLEEGLSNVKQTLADQKKDIADNNDRIQNIRLTLATASGALVIISAVGGFIVNYRFEAIMRMLTELGAK